MSDPWDSTPPSPPVSGRMRCDPKQPLPRLRPQELLALGRQLADAVGQLVAPGVAAVEAVAAAAQREKREREEASIRNGVEIARRRAEREGGATPSMGTPKQVVDPAYARFLLDGLRAQLVNAERAGDDARADSLRQQVAWLEYNIAVAEQGGSGGGGTSGHTGTAHQGNDNPRSDGLQGETQGGAPLAPPPEHTAPPPRRIPIPRPDTGPTRGPDQGPYRTYTPPLRK